jgi:hypothetical protein
VGRKDEVGAGRSTEAAPTEAIRATLDQLEAAERELRAAEEARRTRAEELERVAREAERSIAEAIDACTRERDDLRLRLEALDGRLRELEGMRTRARLGSAGGAASVLDPPAAPSTTEVPSDDAPTVKPYIGDEPKADAGTSYEDEWYAALKQRREAEVAEDDD